MSHSSSDESKAAIATAADGSTNDVFGDGAWLDSLVHCQDVEGCYDNPIQDV